MKKINLKHFLIIYNATGSLLLLLLLSDWMAAGYRLQKEGIELFLIVLFYAFSASLQKRYLRKP